MARVWRGLVLAFARGSAGPGASAYDRAVPRRLRRMPESARPLLVFVSGKPGSGKTTLARRLAEPDALGLPLLDQGRAGGIARHRDSSGASGDRPALVRSLLPDHRSLAARGREPDRRAS